MFSIFNVLVVFISASEFLSIHPAPEESSDAPSPKKKRKVSFSKRFLCYKVAKVNFVSELRSSQRNTVTQTPLNCSAQVAVFSVSQPHWCEIFWQIICVMWP